MKKYFIYLLLFACSITTKAQIGKVVINTNTQLAMLHVKDSSVVFTGTATLPATPGNPPVSGAGTRMMWYPDKAAFRAGQVTDLSWDKDSIGKFSFGVGQDSKASGYSSAAMGSFTTASGLSSTAMGSNTTASGDNGATAMGRSTTATGFTGATAIGFQTHATGDYGAIAMGSNTTAAGSTSTSMGFHTYSKAYSSVTVGRYNDSIASSSNTSWVATDPVFIIGNGTADNARNNALVVLKNGNTNITGEITRTATGTANIVAIAYGAVTDAGVINSGTGNYAIVKSSTGIYDIIINNETYTSGGYTCSVTPIAFGVNVAVASSGSTAGKLRIRLYNIAGGGLIDYPFSFVVFKQ